MKEHLHLRQMSFSPHSWLDLIELGLTQVPLSPEFHGLQKNVLKFQLKDSEQILFLHHWMIADESQVHCTLKEIVAQPVTEISTDINIYPTLSLQSILVGDEATAELMKSKGVNFEKCEDTKWSQYFQIRKRQKLWALIIDIPDHQLELEKTYRFVQHILWKGQKALHIRTESQCLDLILI